MADLSYTVDINSNPAIQSLNKVEKQITQLTGSISKLQAGLAALFAGAVIKSALSFADSISDISKATGVATENVLGFSQAIQANGGNADGAAKMLAKLSLSVDDANQGAVKISDAFSDVGVSLNELKTLSDTDLFAKTIQGLSKIEDNSRRAGLATQLLGKGAKGIDFAGVGGDIGRATDAATKYSASIEKAAEVQDKMQAVLNTVQLSLLNSLKPLLDYVAALDPKKIEDFVDALIKIGAVAAGLTIVGKAIAYMGEAILLIGGLWAAGTSKISSGIAAISAGFASIAVTISKAFESFSAFFRLTPRFAAFESVLGRIGKLIAELGARWGFAELAIAGTAGGIAAFATGVGEVALAIAGVAAAAYGIASIIDSIFDTKIIDTFTSGVSAAYDAAKKFLGIGQLEPAGAGRGTYSKDMIDGLNAYADRQAKLSATEREQMNTRLKALNEFKLQQSQILKSYQEQNTLIATRLGFELTLVGKSSDEVEKARALNDARERQISIVADLVKQQDALKLAMAVPNAHKNEVEDLQKRYDAITNTITQVKAATDQHVTSVGSYVDKIQSAKLIEQDRLNNLTLITQQLDLQKQAADVTSGIHGDIAKQMQDISYKQGQRGQSPAQQQLNDLNKTVNEFQTAAAGKIMAAFETEDGYRNIQQMNEELTKMLAQSEQLRQAKMTDLDLSRQWSTGWQDAFNSYIDNATNAAKMAGDAFNSITSNMNSAIDKFVETGKFSFSDLASSIIKDLIKIELKAQASKILGFLGGGGGIFSTLGSLFGFAGGGDPPVNKPSIVGEKGPELFIPRAAGTIIPNGTGAGGGVVNKTYITNNISAIDSKSVAQLFAENRKMLLGTVQLAQKELPYGNR